MSENFWENYKVGDNVGVSTHWSGLQLQKVIRITKTLIVTDKGKFKRQNGCTGGTYSHDRFVITDKEFWDKYYRQVYTNGIKGYVTDCYAVLDKLSINELKEICLKLKEAHRRD